MAGQTVLVTGAASGVGLACARMLLEDGHRVLAFDIQGERMRQALPAKDDRLVLFEGDVSRTEPCRAAVAAALERFGRLDALIHWGAAHSTTPWDALDAEECNRILAVNVTGSFLIAQAAARPMVEQGVGAIVLTTSTAVLFGPTGGRGNGGPAYVASKAAIIGLTRTLARSLGPNGVRVNAVSPGVTDTPMIAGYDPILQAETVARFPLGRIGRPEEIAAVGCFLISDKASFVTGAVIQANGGANFG